MSEVLACLPSHLRASLGEAEDIIDKQQYILTFLVSEVFGHSQSSQSNPGPSTWWLIHLPIHQRYLQVSDKVRKPGMGPQKPHPQHHQINSPHLKDPPPQKSIKPGSPETQELPFNLPMLPKKTPPQFRTVSTKVLKV